MLTCIAGRLGFCGSDVVAVAGRIVAAVLVPMPYESLSRYIMFG